jgi:hypothetical protein
MSECNLYKQLSANGEWSVLAGVLINGCMLKTKIVPKVLINCLLKQCNRFLTYN